MYFLQFEVVNEIGERPSFHCNKIGNVHQFLNPQHSFSSILLVPDAIRQLIGIEWMICFLGKLFSSSQSFFVPFFWKTRFMALGWFVALRGGRFEVIGTIYKGHLWRWVIMKFFLLLRHAHTENHCVPICYNQPLQFLFPFVQGWRLWHLQRVLFRNGIGVWMVI